jgi:hypothetical protein
MGIFNGGQVCYVGVRKCQNKAVSLYFAGSLVLMSKKMPEAVRACILLNEKKCKDTQRLPNKEQGRARPPPLTLQAVYI